MNISVTEIGVAHRCPRKAVLTSRNGLRLTKIFQPLSLATGTTVHRSHQLWLNDQKQDLRHWTMWAGNEAITKAEEAYKLKVGCEPSDEETAPLYEALDFCLSMADNFHIQYGQPLPKEYDFVSAEQKIEIPVHGTEHRCEKCNGSGAFDYYDAFNRPLSGTCGRCDGSGVALHKIEGRLDGLIRDKRTGAYGVLERKTYNQRPKIEVLRRVDQFRRYAFMLRSLGLSDLPPFLLYDGLWRRHAPPKGRAFSDLFYRARIEWSEHNLNQVERYLPTELNSIAAMYADPDLQHPVVPWMGCNDCGVDEICERMEEGRTYDDLLQRKFTERHDEADVVIEEVA